MSFLRALAFVAAFVAAAPVHAAQFLSRPPYEVHYNAFRADFLDEKMATAAGITRSGDHGVVNVTVVKVAADGTRAPMDAIVTGIVRNLFGDKQALVLRAVRDAGGVSYLAEFELSGTDTYTFELVAQPQGDRREMGLKFSQALTTD